MWRLGADSMLFTARICADALLDSTTLLENIHEKRELDRRRQVSHISLQSYSHDGGVA